VVFSLKHTHHGTDTATLIDFPDFPKEQAFS
jgi:hypothetical protein